MKKSKFFKIAWNGEKISQNRFFDFLAPPPQKKIGYLKKMLSKKYQSCSKLHEMARKLVKKEFWIFKLPLPPPNKNRVPKKNSVNNEKI